MSFSGSSYSISEDDDVRDGSVITDVNGVVLGKGSGSREDLVMTSTSVLSMIGFCSVIVSRR